MIRGTPECLKGVYMSDRAVRDPPQIDGIFLEYRRQVHYRLHVALNDNSFVIVAFPQ